MYNMINISKNIKYLKILMKSKKTKIQYEIIDDDLEISKEVKQLEINSYKKLSKLELLKKLENTNSIPINFKTQWDILEKMRISINAPVDSMGVEYCADTTQTKPIYKFQTLVSLILSSQTKDPTTFAAMNKLINHGLTVDNIIKTDDEKIKELIYGVNFHNNKTKYIKQVYIK